MSHEIETKLKYQDHEGLKRVLMAAGAEFVNESVQRDAYLDDSAGSIRSRDAALRIREETRADGHAEVSVTFKGPCEASSLKKRQEVNLAVTSRQSAEELFAGLGCRKVMVIEKKRKSWRLGGCEVTLDELPLIGRFVEIEGPDEAAVGRVQNRLGLGQLSHIPHSYTVLIQQEMARRGADATDVTFGSESL